MVSPALHKSGRIYVWTVILVGLAVLAKSLHELATTGVGQQWFVLAALTLISGSATVKLPSVPASISISETFVVAAVLLYGPAAGTVIVALDGLIISYWIAKRRREVYRALFNMSAPAVSAWVAAHLFFFLSGIEPLVLAPASLDRVLPSLVVFAATYFGLNSWLIAFAVSLEERVSPVAVWRGHFAWLSLNYFCGASMAVLLVVYTREIDLRFIGVIVPLLLVLYFTFKTSMDRVEDANRHVEKVNRLYLSTIETLAMAIDAKDQVTHGHIRRVQRYAVGLARELGVADEALLKAIEAAALLHDMGKLAIPEHILNKPGRLTEAEFERMKAHASVGAEILSAIDFPYPVVPIVRHHHESWNGTGYPDGLSGTDIPIGARILSVVDCFDALTSDRPYRRRLSDSDAIAILMERRGSMYDPLVVDTFQRVHEKLDAGEHAFLAGSFVGSKDARETETEGDEATIDSGNAVGAARAAAAAVPIALDRLIERLVATVPAKLIVFYRYDKIGDVLIAAASTDLNLGLLSSRIAVGEHL
ncbi:MAG: HD-GYP domain-containing protein, partial [Thermomicrobiales bacterium]